jgi:transglutaminase-like putative cysteine protease
MELETAPEDFPRMRSDGTFVTQSLGARYRVTLAAPGTEGRLAGGRRQNLPAALAPYVELPPRPGVGLVSELAARLTSDLSASVEQHALVTRLTKRLEEDFDYAAPATEGAAVSLQDFLAGDAPGHCELFASALALMLRSLDVPCRVVTGLRSTRWSDESLVFQARDAHSWVEVHEPAAGWYAVDPSPFVDAGGRGIGPWARLRAKAQSLWATVTRFDDTSRAAFFAFLRELPARAGRSVRERPLVGLVLVAPLALVLLWRRSRRRAIDPALCAYRKALRAAHVHLEPGETPRELLQRARRTDAPQGLLARLEAATRAHEVARYSGR